MRKYPSILRAALAVLPAVAFLLAAPLGAAQAEKIDIKYQKFTLDNGLTLIVHEDHKAPIVAFDVWYHVGSKNEIAGKTGFAHLFEHLMFNGSENYNDDYFKPMQKIGATDLNGTTSEDRTNYFENVPVSALDLVLWMESDRMGHLKGAIDQGKLDEQRGVVQNELRQYANEPYSISEDLILKGTYPPDHPYSWSVGGSIEDLNAAKLEDVHKWFQTYYGPNNAVIAIAGDIDAKTALEKVKKYFGDIPPSPPVARQSSWTAKRTGTHRQAAQDRVAQARIQMVWNVPGWGTPCADKLSLIASILSDGKSSRLYKRLVYDDQIATSVSAYAQDREIAGQFNITADARPGVELSVIEKAINEELARFLAEGPTADELERVRTQLQARFIRGLERIGGFGGKADILVQSQVFGGSPDAYKSTLKHIEEATPASLKESAAYWLSDGVYILEITPYPQMKAAQPGADRKSMPVVGPSPEAKFPDIQRAALSNGLKIMLVERRGVPLVDIRLMIDAGYAADALGLPGTANLAMAMLAEGTGKRNAFQISDEFDRLGTRFQAGASVDMSLVYIGALKEKLEPSLEIFSDVILDPSFPEADFQRMKKNQLSRISQEKDSPMMAAFRILPKLMYGEGHAYSYPLTGTGYESTVAKMTRADLVKYHETWFKPGNATLVIVGDTTMAEIKPMLEKYFKGWKAGKVPAKNIATVPAKSRSAVYLINKPGAPQSMVTGGYAVSPSNDPDAIAIEMMNDILGGGFVSRINMNIRENKHWSYGAQSMIMGTKGPRPFMFTAPVQGDKTKETIQEIKGELEGIIGKKPVTGDEFQNAKNSKVLGLPGQWETNAAIQSSLSQIVSFGLPDDYFQKYSGRVNGLKNEDVAKAAAKTIRPDNVVWLVVGDRASVEPKLSELGFKEVVVIDADGNIVK